MDQFEASPAARCVCVGHWDELCKMAELTEMPAQKETQLDVQSVVVDLCTVWWLRVMLAGKCCGWCYVCKVYCGSSATLE